MNWDALGAIGEVVGAFAVVATLVYLAFQIKQSTAATTSASMHSLLGDWREFCRGWAANTAFVTLHRKGSQNFDSLNPDEKYQFFLFMVDFVFQAQVANEMWEQGTISRYDRDVWVNFVISSLNTPGGREMWAQTRHIYTPNIAEILTDGLERESGNPSWMHLTPFLEMGEVPQRLPENTS